MSLNRQAANTIERETSVETRAKTCHKSDIQFHIDGKHFAGRAILDPIAFTLPQGSFTVITGPSGCGKTTLLKIISGLDQPCNGTAANKTPHCGFAFQEPRLLPWRNLRDNLALVCKSHDNVDALLAEMGLLDAAHLYPGQLSLGMARRVSLARAFAVNPDLLLLDEPLVSLDELTAGRLREWLLAFWLKHRPTILMVTHNLREALELADRILILDGTPARIRREHRYRQPRSDRSRTWIDNEVKQLSNSVGFAHDHTPPGVITDDSGNR